MKLYQYEDLKKANHALISFQQNGVPVKKVEIVKISKEEILFFILADPKLENRPKRAKDNGKKEQNKVEKKEEGPKKVTPQEVSKGKS